MECDGADSQVRGTIGCLSQITRTESLRYCMIRRPTDVHNLLNCALFIAYTAIMRLLRSAWWECELLIRKLWNCSIHVQLYLYSRRFDNTKQFIAATLSPFQWDAHAFMCEPHADVELTFDWLELLTLTPYMTSWRDEQQLGARKQLDRKSVESRCWSDAVLLINLGRHRIRWLRLVMSILLAYKLMVGVPSGASH